VKSGRGEIGEIVRFLPEKSLPGSPAVSTARIVPKICQGQPRQCTQSASDFIQISLFSAEL